MLASRLSEDPAVSVLLIEAGARYAFSLFGSGLRSNADYGHSNRDSGVLGRMPMAAPQLFHGPFDWDYKTVYVFPSDPKSFARSDAHIHESPQKEMNDRRIDWPRGKMLGGSR